MIIQGAEEKRLRVHYEVDTSRPPIGAGGMGQVMRGVRVDEATGATREAAIKFLFDDLPESAIERTRREASVRINNENLVEMFGFIEVETTDGAGNTHKRYHVASELLRGVMLHDLMRGKTTDADGEEMEFARELYRQYSCDRLRFAVLIARKILSGVMALHDAGYIHRDIDPSNVMITADGKVKLIDFGICKKLDALGTDDRHLTTAGQFMGKAAYAAPELVMGDVAHQTESTDLYAVGILFYELLTGHVPFDGPTHEVLARQLKEDVPVKDIADKFARKIVQKATAKKQEQRYATAAEFRADVEKLSRTSISAGGGGTNPGETVKISTPTPRNKKGIIIGAAAAVVVAIAVCAAVFMGNKSDEEEALAAQAEQERLIEARRAEIADMILDTMSLQGETDSITGMEIPTAGALISQAREQLIAGEAPRGKALLERVAAKKMKSSAEALALLAALNSRSQTLDTVTIMATEALFPKDYRKAHELNEQALALDATNYRALYELALDYMAGEARGVVDRDLEKTARFLVDARKSAQSAGDEDFLRHIDVPLDILKSEGVTIPAAN